MFNVPRTMKQLSTRERRSGMLREPHISPLTDYVHRLRARDDNEYPYFDPADGGIKATMAFLFEKPGPMTVPKGRDKRSGSGFISRDNDDPTAEATYEFFQKAKIRREHTILWNTVAGWNGTRAIKRDELLGGVADLRDLFELLPKLQVVVLVGKKAEKAEALVSEIPNIEVFKSPHPSPLVRASYPERWNSIPAIWKAAGDRAQQLGERRDQENLGSS